MCAKFEDLRGKTLTEVNVDHEVAEIWFKTDTGDSYKLHHCQDYCERVYIEDVCGDVADLIGTPILLAEESKSNTNPEGVKQKEYADSFMWTFYKLATIKGAVTIRWYGESNGYYSESVYFDRVR